MSKEINLVTSNEDRYQFVKKALNQFKINVEKQPLKIDEIQADTVEEVALKKTLNAVKQLNAPCICEDTELTINALSGFPGPYMKFAQSRLSLEKILLLMKDEKNKAAIFKSILVYAEPSGEHKVFETKLDGEIITSPRGTNGKGWDSIFLVKESRKTLAEYTYEERFLLWNKGYVNFGNWYSQSVTNG